MGSPVMIEENWQARRRLDVGGLQAASPQLAAVPVRRMMPGELAPTWSRPASCIARRIG
jgi:hypothetical protein